MKQTDETKNRAVWADNVRVFAIIAVVVVHVSAYGVSIEYGLQCRANGNWWIANFYESVCRCCVPLFVMLTGSFLLPQVTTLGQFLKKRLSRILLPFVFWSIVYIVFNLALKIKNGDPTTIYQLGPWFSTQILEGAEFHLWYVYMIAGLYLFIPILQPWVKIASNKTLLYFIGLCIVSLTLKQFNIPSTITSIDLRYFGGYIGFLVMGYYLSERVVITARRLHIAIAFFVIGFAVTFIGTYILSNRVQFFNDALYNYLTLNVALLSIGAFVIIKSIQTSGQGTIVNNIRNIMSKYGFSIYLCHPLILILMTHFNIDYKVVNPVIGIPLTVVVCLVISCSVVYVLSRLPYGKYISG